MWKNDDGSTTLTDLELQNIVNRSQDFARKYIGLCNAVHRLYVAAHWYPDRYVKDQDAIWRAIRDAAELPVGKRAILGPEQRPDVRDRDQYIREMREALYLVRKTFLQEAKHIQNELDKVPGTPTV